MYLVCCQIVAYILTVYSSPFPLHLKLISNGYQVQIVAVGYQILSAVWSDCNRFTVQYYSRLSLRFVHFTGQIKLSFSPAYSVNWSKKLTICCYHCSYPVQWWISVWQISLNVFWMFPAISSFTHRLFINHLPFSWLAWQSCKYQRQLDLFCSAVDISCPKML